MSTLRDTSQPVQPVQPGGRGVVLATVPSDAHTWNLIYLELLLQEAGFEVHNLGPCTPADLVVQAANGPDVCAVVLSTVNGHGGIEGQDFVPALYQGGLQVPVAIGGKLGTDDDFERARPRLVAAGCARVFAPTEDPRLLLEWLESEVAMPVGIDTTAAASA